MNSLFTDFCLDYGQLSSEAQAKRILETAELLLAHGARGVAIIYSANYAQTRRIQQTYFSGGWYTGTAGANQAAVMQQMESLMASEYASLQGKVRILPVTTMNAPEHPVRPWNENVHLGIVISDLERICCYLENGWHVLGWQNQETVTDTAHPYAVGGGIVRVPDSVEQKIQDTLKDFARRY